MKKILLGLLSSILVVPTIATIACQTEQKPIDAYSNVDWTDTTFDENLVKPNDWTNVLKNIFLVNKLDITKLTPKVMENNINAITNALKINPKQLAKIEGDFKNNLVEFKGTEINKVLMFEQKIFNFYLDETLDAYKVFGKLGSNFVRTYQWDLPIAEKQTYWDELKLSFLNKSFDVNKKTPTILDFKGKTALSSSYDEIIQGVEHDNLIPPRSAAGFKHYFDIVLVHGFGEVRYNLNWDSNLLIDLQTDANISRKTRINLGWSLAAINKKSDNSSFNWTSNDLFIWQNNGASFSFNIPINYWTFTLRPSHVEEFAVDFNEWSENHPGSSIPDEGAAANNKFLNEYPVK